MILRGWVGEQMRRLKYLIGLAFVCASLGCDDGGSGGAGPTVDAAIAVDARGADGAPVDARVPDAAALDAAAMPLDATAADAGPQDAEVIDALPDAAPEPPCNANQLPLVMAHGLLAAGDTWAPHFKRFTANDHCGNRYHAFDWNTLDRNTDHDAELAAFIDAVRQQHGVDQVDLMGHSAGGGLGYSFLADPARAARVHKYVHVASSANAAPAGPPGAPVSMLNLWSEGDLIVAGADIPGAENVQVPNQDHYSVATAEASFVALHTFLYGYSPAVVEAPDLEPIRVSGKALILAENTPEVGGRVEVWRVSAADGQREGARPAAVFIAAANGGWGPFVADPGQHYEFYLQPARPGAPPVRYYREPFNRPDPLVYLRSLPTSGVAGALLRQIPFTDTQTVLVVFSASAAVIAGRDSLTVDGEEMATAELAAPAATTIALFVYDANGDGQPGGPVATFAALPFLTGVDRSLPADPANHTTIVFNGRTLNVPRLPGRPEGAVIASFN